MICALYHFLGGLLGFNFLGLVLPTFNSYSKFFDILFTNILYLSLACEK